ncbi:hypothetical protein JH146_1104 [Methanocaldococcus bathoardescens]|uniref:Metallo-beta-lactamase domain-containing protein n=1 Tax=Methanocaldococcus bathoardescens TaxID=1301915 RepID=A0A076LGD8_9EURY|nr:hypothetical protein [Methanocaldococcus bathoardescens]AIJ05947.1 hypothetical protein JH146_1104 [Methanocaldococcus bathoardescens]
MKICVMDVGHGLCMPICVSADFKKIEVFTEKRWGIFGKISIEYAEHALVDCGSYNGKEKAFYALHRVSSYISRYTPKYFILSHFHSDHYNGIFCVADKGNHWKGWFDEVYFPGIPKIYDNGKDISNEFILYMLSFEFFQIYNNYGIVNIDFLDLIFKINDKCKLNPCFKGDFIKIRGKTFEILHPPRIIKDDEVVESVKKVIKEFKQFMKDYREFEEIVKFVERYSPLYNIVVQKNMKYEKFNGKKHEETYEILEKLKNLKDRISEKENFKKKIEDLDEKFRGITDRLSLVFCCDNELLFMGDLKPYEINKIIKELNSKNRKFFYVLITPHHGTRWGYKLKDIECIYAISSNGEKYKDKFEKNIPKFKKISENYLSTLEEGDIIISIKSTPKCLCPWGRCFPF